MCVILALLTCLVRCSYAWTWFVCPFTILFVFYYAIAIRVEDEGVSYEFTVPVAISTAYIILVTFNEVWLISSAMFAPVIGFTIFVAGAEMKGTDSGNETIVRTAWCILAFGLISYQLER